MTRIALVLIFLITGLPGNPAHAATFLFIRHAESTSNAGTETTVAEAIDPPLTDLGKKQSADLADILAKQKVTAIYVSAYQRTKLTIAPTATRLGLTPVVDPRTNEWYFGDLQNLKDRDNPKIVAVLQAWSAGRTSAKANLPRAESLDDMAARVLPAWQEIINAHKHEDGVVILVGHGAETGFVMPYLANNISLAFAFTHGLRNTGIVQVEIVDDQPVVTKWQGMSLFTPAAVPETAH